MSTITTLQIQVQLAQLRAQLCQAFEKKDAAAIAQLSSAIDAYQISLWRLQEKEEKISV